MPITQLSIYTLGCLSEFTIPSEGGMDKHSRKRKCSRSHVVEVSHRKMGGSDSAQWELDDSSTGGGGIGLLTMPETRTPHKEQHF